MSPFTYPLLIAALLLIAYLMVTAVLTVLASHIKHHLDRHELLRQTRTRRLEYEREVLQRQKQVAGEVEVVEEGPAHEPLPFPPTTDHRLAA